MSKSIAGVMRELPKVVAPKAPPKAGGHPHANLGKFLHPKKGSK